MKKLRYSGSGSTDTGDINLEESGKEYKNIRHAWINRIGKSLLVFSIIAALVIEGYYIFLLQDKIDRQTEELKNISVELLFLKNEREKLNNEISSVKKQTGNNRE